MYNISANVPTQFRDAIRTSFGTWDALSGATWNLDYIDGGVTTSTTFGGYPDGLNNVTWITNNWSDITLTDDNTIGVARVLYNAYTGELVEVDLALKVLANPVRNYQYHTILQ